MSLFKELKRRNVLRAAAAYVVTAWLIIQVAETTLPAFGFGDAGVRVVIIVLAVGFLPAMVLAWAFEWTPGGLRREGKVDHAAPAQLELGKRLDRLIMVVLALGLCYFAFDKFVLDPARDKAREQAIAKQARSDALVEAYGDKSIAVLPFVNMSDDPGNEYFADGIAEELLNLLAQLGDLRVISRSSSFSFKGKDINTPKIAAQLDVAYVLEGSVRKAGERVRITAQLIEAATDTHLWSDTYDRTLDDIFAIQDEISAAIVGELKQHMGLEVDSLPKANGTAINAAYEAYLRGRYLFAQRTLESIENAVDAFGEAVTLDPDYAAAHAGLSLANRFLTLYGDMPKNEAVARARPHAERALELDPNLAEAHAAMGYVLVYPNTIDQAIKHFRRAIELNPNYADAYLWVAGFIGYSPANLQEAFAMLQKALQRDPLNIAARANVIGELMQRDRLTEADRELEILKSIDSMRYRYIMIDRKALGGNWAEGALTALEGWIAHPDFGDFRVQFNSLLAAMDLEQEALGLANEAHPDLYRMLGRPKDALKAAEVSFAADPQVRTRSALALALASVGDYRGALPELEETWERLEHSIAPPFFGADHALALLAARRAVGEDPRQREVVSALEQAARDYREAGIVNGWGWHPDYVAGLAAWLSGERERGLGLIAQAADKGNFIFPNEAYLQPLYDDPGFRATKEKQRAIQAREQKEFLDVVCTDNPFAAVWQPAEATCNLN